jgi:hypothetical protein
MAGLVPAIHALDIGKTKDADVRHEAGLTTANVEGITP